MARRTGKEIATASEDAKEQTSKTKQNKKHGICWDEKKTKQNKIVDKSYHTTWRDKSNDISERRET